MAGVPAAHVQFAVRRLDVVAAADPPSQYEPGDADSAPPHVSPPPATLAPVTGSRIDARAQPAPKPVQVAFAAAQDVAAVSA